MYVCMYACMYECIYVCIYASMHVRMYVCKYKCMYVFMYVCMRSCICRVPEVDPYQSTIGTAMLYQVSIDVWYSYYLYQKSIDFWYSTNCTRSRSAFWTALIVPKLDRLLAQALRLYHSTIGTGLFSDLSPWF